MAGRFEGLTDDEWSQLEDLFPKPEKRGKGMPHVPFRKVINTLLYVLITGCRWSDVPLGPIWASKSAAHRWLKRWEADGTLLELKNRILGLAEEQGQIDWNFGAVDGSFSPGKGGGSGVAHGHKGKGVLIHTLRELMECHWLIQRHQPMVMNERKSFLFWMRSNRKPTPQGDPVSVSASLWPIKDMIPKNLGEPFAVAESGHNYLNEFGNLKRAQDVQYLLMFLDFFYPEHLLGFSENTVV